MKRIMSMLIFLTMFVTFSCISAGNREEPDSAESGPEQSAETQETESGGSGATTIEGTISMKGSMPRIYLACTTPEGTEYRIVGPLEEKLSLEYQNRMVILSGKIVKEALGPGFPAEFRAEEIRLQKEKVDG